MSHKWILKVLIIVIAILFGGAWLYLRGVERGKDVAFSPLLYLNETARSRPLARDMERQQEALGSTEDELLSCELDWRRIVSTSSLELRRSLLEREPLLGASCQSYMIENTESASVLRFLQSCLSRLDVLPNQALRTRCLPLLPAFTTYIKNEVGDKAFALRDDQSREQILREQLIGAFQSLSEASRGEILSNIKKANELIDANPGAYIGYKTKLINLLIMELKYEEDISLRTYRELYETMLSFRDQQFNENQSFEGDEKLLLNSVEIDGRDPDLIHIPFIRLAGLEEWGDLAQLGQDYIDTYPDSYIGYLYAADALWEQGDRRGAIEMMSNAFPAQDFSLNAFYPLFEQYQELTPVERLSQMGLGI